MRELTPTPVARSASFVVLAGALWFLTSLLSPAPERVASLSFEAAAKSLSLPASATGAKVVAADPSDATCARAVSAVAIAAEAPPVADPGKPTITVRCSTLGDVTGVSARVDAGGAEAPIELSAARQIPSSTSILPPLLGILFALVFRKVLLALFLAVVLGALFVTRGDPLAAAAKTGSDYLLSVVTDSWNLYIFGFTLLLVGLVHVAIKMGGMRGVVNALSRIARGRRSAQAAAGAVGLAVFFDDYANTVVVGSSVRPLTDSHRVSREKLAYIVDSTAAPVAGLAVISTWIGFEIATFNQQLDSIKAVASSGYEFFFQILPYRFYCIFAIGLVFLVAWTGRDFGPMLKAERRAFKTGHVRRPDATTDASGAPIDASLRHETAMKAGAPPRWVNGVLPILVVVFGAFIGSVVIGSANLDATRPGWDHGLGLLTEWRDAFIASSDDTMAILFWAALAGAVTAFGLALGQRILTPIESGRAFFDGAWMIAPVIAILVLAIALRHVTDELGTPQYLVALIGDLPLWVMPAAIFALAAFIAFATGTSWGTMGILIPVALPLVAAMAHGQPNGELILVLAGSAVLDGAIFGDHCSLISDTTIMSSLASGCDHIDHVKTQLPYALLAMTVAGVIGYLAMAWSPVQLPVWGVYLTGFGLMWLWLVLRGRRAEGGP